MRWIPSLSVLALVASCSSDPRTSRTVEAPAQPSAALAAFEKLKALAGWWEVTQAPEGTPKGSTYAYKVTSGGSALLETLFAGSEIEMISVYYVDGRDLFMTHYCLLKNQPHLRAVSVGDQRLAFTCTEEAERKIGARDHMHAGTIVFADADHIKFTWEAHKDGHGQGANTFELTRRKR